MNFPNLSSFLSGYLHQDWDVEYDSPADAIADFTRKELTSTIDATLQELNELLSLGLSDDDLTRWLLQIGCYYLPTESARAWLSDVQEQLVREAE